MYQFVSLTRSFRPLAISLCFLLFVFGANADDQEKSLREPVPGDDFVIREAMIPMRDGVKLYTIIMVPKDSDGNLPIMMNRTPYDASGILRGPASTKLGVNVGTQFLGNDYIYASQDIRGRFKSEGDYVMFRHPRGPLNDSDTDHTTDTWDTIEWLVNNVESNGRPASYTECAAARLTGGVTPSE